MPTKSAEWRDYMEQAAEARRRGDLALADAAEVAAVLLLRALFAEPAKAVQP
jgi:hypothetical protein